MPSAWRYISICFCVKIYIKPEKTMKRSRYLLRKILSLGADFHILTSEKFDFSHLRKNFPRFHALKEENNSWEQAHLDSSSSTAVTLKGGHLYHPIVASCSRWREWQYCWGEMKGSGRIRRRIRSSSRFSFAKTVSTADTRLVTTLNSRVILWCDIVVV